MSRIIPVNLRQTSKSLNYDVIGGSSYYYGVQLKKILAIDKSIESLGRTLFFPTGPTKKKQLQTLQPMVLPVFSQLRFDKFMALQLANSRVWFLNRRLTRGSVIFNVKKSNFFNTLNCLNSPFAPSLPSYEGSDRKGLLTDALIETTKKCYFSGQELEETKLVELNPKDKSALERPEMLSLAIGMVMSTKKTYDYQNKKKLGSLKSVINLSLRKPKSFIVSGSTRSRERESVFYDFQFLQEVFDAFKPSLPLVTEKKDKGQDSFNMTHLVHASGLTFKKTMIRDPLSCAPVLLTGKKEVLRVENENEKEGIESLDIKKKEYIRASKPAQSISEVEQCMTCCLKPKFASLWRFNRPIKLYLFGFLIGRYPADISQNSFPLKEGNEEEKKWKKSSLQQEDWLDGYALKQSVGVSRLKSAVIFGLEISKNQSSSQIKTLRPSLSMRF
jgi:hypothetical protein